MGQYRTKRQNKSCFIYKKTHFNPVEKYCLSCDLLVKTKYPLYKIDIE